MSIEEKAKAYDEALERARKYMAKGYDVLMPEIFPELRESEDERIRKGLIEVVSDIAGGWPFEEHRITKKEALAYLERQKYNRMKPIYDARESFESALEKAWNDYHNGYENVDKLEDDYVECAHAKGFREGYLFGLEKQKDQNHDGKKWIYEDDYHKDMERSFNDGKDEVLENPEKYGLQKEQKPADTYNDWRNIVYYVLKEWLGIGQYMDMAPFSEIVKTLQEKYSLPKPAEWSEEDEGLLDEAIHMLDGGWVRSDDAIKQVSDFLNSLPERFNLQPKQEWSKEDEKMLKNILWVLESYISKGESAASPSLIVSYPTYYKEIDWLKSLRPSWKPSKEQMEELWNVISYIEKPNSNFLGVPVLLESLYKHLKELM